MQPDCICHGTLLLLFKAVAATHAEPKRKYTLAEDAKIPFWQFYDRMTLVKSKNRADPVISSGAAKMQQEVGRSMLVLHVLHHPTDTPLEIDKAMFDLAVEEVQYFGAVANQGRPPNSTTVFDLNPQDDVTTVALRTALFNLRGTHFTGLQARKCLGLSDQEALLRWLASDAVGGRLESLKFLSVNRNLRHGVAIDKLPVPEDEDEARLFSDSLVSHCRMSVVEYRSCLHAAGGVPAAPSASRPGHGMPSIHPAGSAARVAPSSAARSALSELRVRPPPRRPRSEEADEDAMLEGLVGGDVTPRSLLAEASPLRSDDSPERDGGTGLPPRMSQTLRDSAVLRPRREIYQEIRRSPSAARAMPSSIAAELQGEPRRRKRRHE